MSLLTNLRETVFRAITLHYLQACARKHRREHPEMAIFAFDFIGHQINVFGRYEKAELNKLAEVIYTERRTETALDIGANIGNHSRFFADIFKSVHAFEPNPTILPLLQYNLRNSRNVVVHPFGASSRNGEVEALVPRFNSGGGHVAAGNPTDDEERISFDLRRLDEMPGFMNIDLIKIDIEGHELQAIDGMAQLISACSPLIAFEQNSNQIINGSTPAVERLRELGYSHFYEITTPKSRITQTLPRWLRGLLRLFESCMVSPLLNASLIHLQCFEPRNYQMVISSQKPLEDSCD
jgi:FkbM family methyltransferase